MKGYSFDELVKLAMAAVKRAGDTMTGNLTTPKVLVSEAQGTESNALTRKDYVDTQLSGKLSTSGGTITGPLRVEANPGVAKLIFADDTGSDLAILHDDSYTAFREGEQGVDLLALTGGETPAVAMRNPRAALAQEQMPQSLTRKDYVDSALASKLGNTGVQTISGELVLNSHAPILTLGETDTGKKWLLVADNFGARFQMGGTDGTEGWAVDGVGSMTLRDPHTMTAQGNSVSSITRKDYVDGQVATRAPMAHNHTVAAITDLKPQDANATADTLALRDGAADVHARLLRTTFGDESRLVGAIAFRVNNSTDNYTRYCSNPGAVREWMKDARTEWHMGWRAYIVDPNNPMTEYHIPGRAAVMAYLADDNIYRISSSNGVGGAITTRLALDLYGNLYATGAVYEAGQRVYSPNNPPPLVSHNHPAYSGNSDVVAGGWDHVGAYVMAQVYPADGIGEIPPGNRLSGAFLRPCSIDNDPDDMYGATLPGSWQCQGYARGKAAGEKDWTGHKTLWIRVA